MCCSLVIVVVLAAMELTPAFGLQNVDLNPNYVEITFMGDDSITVYADGQPIGTESCSQNSDNASRGICDKGVGRAPADVEQLAIAGYDLVPNSEYGLIMSTSNGIYTNSSWKCKAKPVYNSNAWLHSNFDDSDWDYAEETDKNERHALPSDFHPKARWIWAKEDGGQMPIMCRFHQYRNKCNRDSCKNGGTCYRMDDYNYKCTCPQGITGKNCETDIVKCASSPCVNGGICLETIDHHYTCICKPGYEGSTCEKESDGCGSSPCQNGATCYKKDSGFMCQCKTGYAGKMCETKLVSNIDKCGSNPCHHGGSCQGGGTNGYTCKCKAGYTGNQCESYVNYCASKPCLNGATCSNEFDRYTCLCKANYVGDICESSNHNIDSERAKKQNVNVHLDSDYSNIHKRDDTDNCESKPCLNGGTCINKENMYICNCKSDYTGINCESYKVENVYVSSSTVTQESDVDVCKDAVCPLHSNCVVEKERINTYKCQCHPGWDSNADCEHKCSPGTYGQDCEGKCHCLGEENCDPITGSCSSGCAEGYSGMDCSKTKARDILDVPNHYNTDSCASNPCLNDGTCSNEGDRYRCHCKLDYMGNICESNKYYIANDGRAERTVESDIDNCGSNPCHHGGSCWSGINGYTCKCKAGYTGNQCKNYVDYCASKPCLNGATCSNEFDRYVCLCKASHVGEICESSKYGIDSERAEIENVNVHLNSDYSNIHKRDDTDNCDTQPCLNGGTCIQKENMYICNCKVDYTGINCESYKVENVYVSSSTVTQESAVDVCKDAVCPLHSNCVVEKERINTYKCQCHPGWDNNADCEHKCSPGTFGQDCQGKCHCLGDESCNPITGSCSSGCAEGYSGMDCSKTRAKDYLNVHKRDHTNWCASKPCLHGATCANLMDGYSCICTQRYTGMQCENIVDTCDSKPCLNDARCLSKNGHFNCSCVPGYTGVNCETNINECSSNPCTNNGSCSDIINAYKCKCVSGHVGDNCEFLEDRCSSNPCQHGGSCWSGINGYTCECKAGYMGNECEHYMNYCASEPCLNGATCSNGFDTYICLCKMDYTGIICATSHLSNEVGQMQYTNKSSNTSNQLRESRDVCKEANCPIHAHCVASMDQIDVYDCLCDPGWDINSYCKEKCSPGTFGEYCKGKCHCSDDTPCDHVTGLCTKGCADGYWGNDCSLSKKRDVTDSADNTDHCADASCPHHSECVNHVNRYTCRCDEGWDPKTGCQKKCSNGTFGQDCENKCKPGWDASYLCEKKCSPGTFGQDCQGKCHCFGDTVCDSETGSCPRGCADGYTGDDCSKVVSTGSNIAEQHLTTSSSNYNYCLRAQCPYKSKCVNREYGHICQCHPGWNPDANCEEQCSLGTFGQNCEGRCHCFDGVPCDSTTGSCPNGCADGYSGLDCSSTANQARDLTTMASTLDDNDDCRNGKCPLHSRCVELESRYTCQCELGWDPRTKCSNKCPLGTYGQDCQKTCFCSNPEQCDAQTGDCIFPVTAQYNTVTTSNENTGPCSNVDVCPGNMQCVANKQRRNRYKCKCLPGWDTSYKCETKCRPGSFGQDCEGTCHCLGDLHCNHKTGSCPSGCKFGYEGFNCSIVRLSPTAVQSVDQVTVLPSTVTAESIDTDYLFSSNVEPDNSLIATNIDQGQLSLSTKETQDTDSCRSVICPTHSKCIDGNTTYKCVCYLGWDPTFHCEKKCSTGTFGQDCEGQCNCLHHAPCDVAIGLCPSGCAMGYWGLNCSRTYQEPAKAAIKSREVVRGNFKGNMSAIVAASVLGGVLCVVIVGGIGIAVYKWRKSRHQEDTIELTIYASDNH